MAIARASGLLQQMGFPGEAAELDPLLYPEDRDRAAAFEADFSPPADYSGDRLRARLQELRDRLAQQCRFTIRYRNSRGDEATYDLDRAELRLHDGTLYLFALVPDLPPEMLPKTRKAETFDRNVLFRIERIHDVGPASDLPWTFSDFGRLRVRYQLKGPLATYEPRRPRERVVERDLERKVAIVESEEDFVFWFVQRLMRYREHAIALEPEWLVEEISENVRKMRENYG